MNSQLESGFNTLSPFLVRLKRVAFSHHHHQHLPFPLATTLALVAYITLAFIDLTLEAGSHACHHHFFTIANQVRASQVTDDESLNAAVPST